MIAEHDPGFELFQEFQGLARLGSLAHHIAHRIQGIGTGDETETVQQLRKFVRAAVQIADEKPSLHAVMLPKFPGVKMNMTAKRTGIRLTISFGISPQSTHDFPHNREIANRRPQRWKIGSQSARKRRY